MKVLIINNTAIVKQNNGYYTFRNDEVASVLKEKDHEIEFFQFITHTKSPMNTFNLEKEGFKVTGIKRFSPKLFNYFYAYFIGIIRILKNDFTYYSYPGSFKWLCLFSIFARRNFGLYLRGSKNVNSKFSKFLYKKAKVVFCVSPLFTKMVNDAGGNGIDKKPTIPFVYEDIIYDRLYKKKDKYNILFLGRIDPDKGLHELLEAFEHLIVHKNYNLKLEIVGDGSILADLRNKVKELNLDNHITFYGAIMEHQEIKRKYLNSDIYILPTYHEGFARTLCEAMIFGTPIITTFVGGIPGIMKENWNALKIEPKSSSSITKILSLAIDKYDTIMKDCALNGTDTVQKLINPNKLSHGEHLSKILEDINE